LEFAGVKREGKLMKTRKRTVLDKGGKCDKTWSQVKMLAGGRISWRRFTDGYVRNEQRIHYYYYYYYCY
jgi:hypothetical protein